MIHYPFFFFSIFFFFTNYGALNKCVCHPCPRALLIFFASSNFSICAKYTTEVSEIHSPCGHYYHEMDIDSPKSIPTPDKQLRTLSQG